jgi:hypothetical protein
MPPKKATTMMKKPCMVAPKVKPPTMFGVDFAKELAPRVVVTADQNKRRHIQRQ